MTEIGLPNDTQIKAAINLFDRITRLKRNDDILKDLKGQVTDSCDFYGILLQALAVNDFYSARCPDVYRAAKWISDNQVMQCNRGDDASRIKLVKDIATLGGQIKDDGWPVFASKFAHFFIDPEAFPILDKNAEGMVLIHLGKRKLYPESEEKAYTKGDRYKEFYDNFCSLKKKLVEKYGDELIRNKHLDEYLWLAANCRNIKLEASGPNPDVKEQIEKGDQSIKDLFGKLFPYPDPLSDNPVLKKNIENKERQREDRRRNASQGNRRQ